MSSRTSFSNRACTAARALDVIGDDWTLLIIRDLLYGIRRFDALQAELGISRKVLTLRLNRLVRDGIVEKRPYLSKPKRYEYVLTDKGQELQPILFLLGEWGSRWLIRGRKAPLEFVHKDCGQPAHPTTYCSHCHTPIHSRNVRVRARPSAKVEADRIEACAGRPVFIRD